MSEQIDIKIFNWGPCVTKFKIKPVFVLAYYISPLSYSLTFNSMYNTIIDTGIPIKNKPIIKVHHRF